eukprot:362182-Chlamydomonas_euryale.AAC.5
MLLLHWHDWGSCSLRVHTSATPQPCATVLTPPSLPCSPILTTHRPTFGRLAARRERQKVIAPPQRCPPRPWHRGIAGWAARVTWRVAARGIITGSRSSRPRGHA